MHFSLFSYGISWFVNNVTSNFGISGSTGKKDTGRMIGRSSMLGTWTFGTIGRGWILKIALLGVLDHIEST
jgi:hypothetical protein